MVETTCRMKSGTTMLTDTKSPAPGELGASSPPPGPPHNPRVAAGWWLAAIVGVAVAAPVSVVAAGETDLSRAHRAAAAATALLVVVALAILAHVVLYWYQAWTIGATGSAPAEPTVAFRRRGLKAALMGKDGRASTSKTQVVLWTGAVVWALVDLLLLARGYRSGNLFTNAVTKNWRPEYLVLLGLPVAAATTAKAVVAGSNSGHGPAATGSSLELAGRLRACRPCYHQHRLHLGGGGMAILSTRAGAIGGPGRLTNEGLGDSVVGLSHALRAGA
jgi:hypothetical protein